MKVLLLIVMLMSALYGVSLTNAETKDIVYMCSQLGLVCLVLYAMNKFIYSKDVVLVANPMFIFIYISIAYFYMDSFTYLSPYFLEIDPLVKFIGACVVSASLIAMIYVYSKYQAKTIASSRVADGFLSIPSPVGYVVFALQIALIAFLRNRGITSINYNEEMSITNQEFGWDIFFPILMLSSTLQVTSFMAGIMLSKPVNISGLFSRYAGVIIIVSNIVIVLLVIRGRFTLFSCAINFLVALQIYYKKLGCRALELLAWLFPMGIAYLGMIVLIAMGRQNQITYQKPLEAYANRLAFVHYATRMAESTIDLEVRLAVATDAVVYTTPQLLLPRKFDLLTHGYERANRQANLPDKIDWADTLFSSGAMLGGWIGFFCLPILFSWFIAAMSKFAVGQSGTLGPIRLLMYLTMLLISNNIELDPSSMLSFMRHQLLIACLLGLIIIPVYALSGNAKPAMLPSRIKIIPYKKYQ